MLISKRFYKLVLISKYGDDSSAKEKMRLLYPKFFDADPLTSKEMDEIEKEVIGRVLSSDHRRVNESILETPSIIEAYLESDYEPLINDQEQNALELETGLNKLERDVQKIRDEILAGMDEEGRRKAIELGLV